MGLATQANDWEVRLESLITLSILAGLTQASISIRSKKARCEASFLISGGSLGLSWHGGFSPGNYGPVTCLRPFSVSDLDGTHGKVSFEGLALAIGVMAVWVSARHRNGELLFYDTWAADVEGGIGIGAGTMRGIWRLRETWVADGGNAMMGNPSGVVEAAADAAGSSGAAAQIGGQPPV